MPALVPKAVREYYAEQHVRTLDLEAVRQFQTTPAASGDTGSTRARGVQRLIQCSFAVNAVLTVSKIVVFVSSHSFAILVSLIDSFLDLVSTAVLWRIAAAAAPHSRLRLQFPVGKNTLEPIGTLIFSVVLSVAMFIAATGALTALVQGLLRPAHPVRSGPSFGTSAAVVIGVTVLAKTVLYVLLKWSPARGETLVRACASDHRNDAISNTAGLAAGYFAGRFPTELWWLDPAVALTMAATIAVLWVRTSRVQIKLLSGVSASPSTLAKLTAMAYSHDRRVLKVDTVRAYHFGAKLFVEVHLVLDPETPLRVAHDVGESLQQNIEVHCASDVARAFVHLDYEWDHLPDREHCTRD